MGDKLGGVTGFTGVQEKCTGSLTVIYMGSVGEFTGFTVVYGELLMGILLLLFFNVLGFNLILLGFTEFA